ncbi:MAG TPA: hypothetical protein VF039_03810 [Longimicrobiales bacterium]
MTNGSDALREWRTGTLTLFGAAPTQARLEVTPRPRSRRMTRAALSAGATLLGAAVAAIVPPHVPWALGVLGFGAWRTRAEWRGEYRLHAFDGSCPRCAAPLRLEEKYVTPPLAVPCYGCHAQPQLTLDQADSSGAASSPAGTIAP